MSNFMQCPDSNLDYRVDWSAWLDASDRITVSVWVAETGLTIGVNTHTDRETLVWLTGGRAGTRYRVTNTITTAQGRVHCQVLVIRVE